MQYFNGLTASSYCSSTNKERVVAPCLSRFGTDGIYLSSLATGTFTPHDLTELSLTDLI